MQHSTCLASCTSLKSFNASPLPRYSRPGDSLQALSYVLPRHSSHKYHSELSFLLQRLGNQESQIVHPVQTPPLPLPDHTIMQLRRERYGELDIAFLARHAPSIGTVSRPHLLHTHKMGIAYIWVVILSQLARWD